MDRDTSGEHIKQQPTRMSASKRTSHGARGVAQGRDVGIERCRIKQAKCPMPRTLSRAHKMTVTAVFAGQATPYKKNRKTTVSTDKEIPQWVSWREVWLCRERAKVVQSNAEVCVAVPAPGCSTGPRARRSWRRRPGRRRCTHGRPSP